MPVSIALALVMALWVNGRSRDAASCAWPSSRRPILPMIAAANIWLFFYTPGYGLIDQIAGAVRLRRASTGWATPRTALPALMVVTVWKEAGFFMIFYLAALQQVPPDL